MPNTIKGCQRESITSTLICCRMLITTAAAAAPNTLPMPPRIVAATAKVMTCSANSG